MKSIRSVSIIFFAIYLHTTVAQVAPIRVSVSRDTILLGNAFYVQYSFESKDGQLVTPEIKGAEIIGQNFMSSTSIQNGEIKAIHKQRFLILPAKEGNFTIPGTSVKPINPESNSAEIADVHVFVKSNPQHLEVEPEEDGNWQFSEIKTGPVAPQRKSKKL